MKLTRTMAAIAFTAAMAVTPVLAEETAISEMEMLRAQIELDKVLVVEDNLELTEAEAEGFWPVYDAYQRELQSINQRIAVLIDVYAIAYVEDSLNDEVATALIDEMLAIEHAEADLQSDFRPKLDAVMPPTKVARYLQIERKIRAVLAYEVAAAVPLAE